MAIHDDNWTEEMPNMYTYSKKERISAGAMATLILLAVAMPFFPVLYDVLEIPLIVAMLVLAISTIYYFLRIAIRGR